MSYGSVGHTHLHRTGKTKKFIEQSLQEGSILHQVSRKDTLQGLALKYDTQIHEIMRANNLWNSDDIHGHKTLLIPKSQSPSEERIPLAQQKQQKQQKQQTVSIEKRVSDTALKKPS